MTGFAPCESCGGNRWRTIIKGQRYLCRVIIYEQGKQPRECGNIRDKKKK